MNHQMNEGFQLIHDLFRLRWIPEIVQTIDMGESRYSELKRNIGEISNTELNRKLSLLLERQVIQKTATGYVLLPFGKDLSHIFNHFMEMSQKYLKQEVN